METVAELLQRCRAHDHEAWRQLVTRYQRLVYSVARRNGLEAEDAEDVTQVSFLVLYSSMEKIKDPEQLASWLMTVARRESWRVRDTRRKVVRVGDLSPYMEDTDDHVDGLLNKSEVKRAMSLLDPASRQLIWELFFSPDQPCYSDIAKKLNRKIGSIGPARGRALDQLRMHLDAS